MRVRVTIETPRGTFVKRDGDRVEYVSPVPCPWNYGFVPGTSADDGDPQDALVLGPRLRRGETVEADVRGVVRFVDAGRADDKLVCGGAALTPRDLVRLRAFFRAYAVARRLLNALRGRHGATRCVRVDDAA